jgi:predicted Fe-S protein YdhL (DUF1289 family)
MHLYGDRLSRYLADDLEPGERAGIDVHIANCLGCTRTLSERGATSGAWERRGPLQRLVWAQIPAKPDVAIAESHRRAA